MKISKLFHWLYAFLMFLPIVLFIPNALYYGFNEHATNSETTTINYKYQSNEVNTLDDLVEGNIYMFDTFVITQDYDSDFYCEFLDFEDYSIGNISIEESFEGHYNGNISYEEGNFYLSLNNANINLSLDSTGLNLQDFYFNDFIFIYNSTLDYVFETRNELPHYTDYNVIESVEINTDDTISNKMYQAWQSTWDLPLLSWTHDTFVAAPFTYITGLFGIGSDNTLNYVFAYFVSISICWLVFDLIMYVPNLAHRWLDKGALE